MGEGVTNPADSAVDGPSVLCAACLKLLFLFGVSCVIALHWRKHRREVANSDAAANEENSVSLREEKPSSTSLTGNNQPHLRRSLRCGIVSQLQPIVNNMEQLNLDVPPDPQPDSFFTWDSGGNSGDYSFVHTAVELPKYPDGAITEEERQMLLLYVQSGHPELLLNSANEPVMAAHSLLGPPPISDTLMCDQATVRGFLETIVEENSDDLRSPSDCDETSVGWGSWDESDDDRDTVVEMETSDQNKVINTRSDSKHALEDQDSANNINVTKRKIPVPTSGYTFPDNLKIQNSIYEAENQLGIWKLPDKELVTLTSATTVDNCAIENRCAVFTNVTIDNGVDSGEVGVPNALVRTNNTTIMDTNAKVSLNSKINSDFESLWISANKLDNSCVETVNTAWCKSESHYLPKSSDIENVNFNFSNYSESADAHSLLVLGTDDLCLIPSGASQSETRDAELMFSDNFKDYFLPTENCVPAFNKTDDSDFKDVYVTENISANTKMKCFRIGFETEPTEIVNDENPSPVNLENENSANSDLQQERLFSPRDGDVVYGSSWLNGPTIKTPEKSSSSTEARFSTVLSESPPSDNIRKSLHLSDQSGSDDEIQKVPNSLSRWQHHTDLQHLQEATSPITRWQHHSDLHRNSNDDTLSNQNYSDEDSDNGLPPQLKQIYSSFKMKDKKMGRIRIKEDKNNNFKKLGLWDNETKVTLPPFSNSYTNGECSQLVNNKISKEEELDDLELDMFSVNKNNSDIKLKSSSSADPDIDDALQSFNHLDDYSSNSEENSESENSYTVNTVENIDYNEELSNPSTPDPSSLKNTAFKTCGDEHLKSENENTCSDNSDNCPLCTDPTFKNSKLNDIFATPTTEKFIDNSIQSLLLNTFPKISGLQEDNVSESNGGLDSPSTLTSSDSDEGIRTNIKKRTRRRLKDNSIVELKHDDSGYVEDDEDDDDDSLEEKDIKDPIKILSNIPSTIEAGNKIRKSLSSVFYESKSSTDSSAPSGTIPKSFEEFSQQLEQSGFIEDVKTKFMENDKWNVPQNLSQFSAWLLDKELKKISVRDEMEKLIVNDIMSLREQTIAQFLKNSTVEEKEDFLLPVTEKSEGTEINELLTSKNNVLVMELLKSAETDFKKSDCVKSILNETIIEENENELNSDSDKTYSDENSEEKIEQSSEELDPEYYTFNTNSNVSKILPNNNLINLNDDAIERDLKNLSDIIFEKLEQSESLNTKNETIDSNIKFIENELVFVEAAGTMQNEVKTMQFEYQQEPVVICSENITSASDNVIIQTDQNTELDTDEKQECVTLRHQDGDNTKLEMRTEIICTTNSAMLNEEEPTKAVESSEINTMRIGEKEILSEVSPSVENISKYKVCNKINLEKNLNNDNLVINENSSSEASETDNEMQMKVVEMETENIPIHFEKENVIKEIMSSTDINEMQKENQLNIKVNTIENENALPFMVSNNLLLKEIDKIPTPVENSLPAAVVAPSSVDIVNQTVLTSGNEIDLMISDRNEAKGAYEGFSNDIISLEAKVVSKEVDSVKHVTGVDYHAYDEFASDTRPIVNDNLCTLQLLDDANSSLSESDFVNVIAKTVNEALPNEAVTVSESVTTPYGVTGLDEFSSEINNNTSEQAISAKVIETKPSDYPSDNNSVRDILISKSYTNRDGSHLSNLYKSKSVTVLQTEDDFEEDDEEQHHILEDADKLIVDNSTDEIYVLNCTSGVNSVSSDENTDKIISPITKSSDDLSVASTKDQFGDIHEKYKRSRSVGRENQEEKETFESWTGQSKSTPDLSRCHDQQLNSSVPLSALLSKSVSQRIQDYLGKSSRGSVITRSLPPNERSRHYRRICVSTETVVERAARFEARSKSSGRESSVEPVNSRSGSCPPLNMRTNDVMRSVRNYSKPTAAVRPTVDIYRNSQDYGTKMVYGVKKTEEDLFELITGYNKATKVTHKPPVPPSNPQLQQTLKNYRLKGKIASARKEFFEKLSQSDLRSKAGNKQSNDIDAEDDTCELRRFSEFRKSAREERARMAQSHPDLGALEAAVRSSRRRIDQLKKRRQKAPSLDAGPRPSSDAEMPVTAAPSKTKDGTLVLPYRRCTGEIAWASCAKRLQEAKSRSDSKSQEPLEIVDERRFKRPAERLPLRAQDYENAAEEDYDDPGPAISGSDFSRARSMDFLLDNREGAEPPENRLAQRVKSEHELRIERSLQNLALPDWYTQSKKQKEGFILRRGSEGSAGESRKRWLGFSSSRTPSTTSLTTPPSSYSQRNIIIPKRVTPTSTEWRFIGSLVSSRESLTPASPASLSPRECSSAAFNYGLNASLSRWSSSRLSTSSAPLTSLSVHRSFRQPYLGWRAAATSSGGASRSSPGVSPINATTPLQGSRPESPRRGSQEHQYGYGLQQNQVTSAATLRPEGNEPGDSGSRISPLALYDNSTNVFFNSNIEVPEFSTPELRRDRYSYTQSLYSGTVIVSPGTEFKPVPSIAEDTSSTTDDRFSMSKSPQPPPRIWMESSFVGSKKDGKDQVQYPQGRTIRIVPSDSVRSGDSNRVGGSSVRSTCAPQTAMDTRELIDHLHNFLRGLQNRNQMIRPSSNSAFTPVSSSSNSGFHQASTTASHEDSCGSRSASTTHNHEQRPTLINYETEPKAYPRGSWRHSSSSSKDISPDNSSTDNELWLSVGEDMGSHSFSRATPEHLDARSSSRSSISPPSPPARYPQQQKRVSEDSTGSSRPIFFASSRRGSKGSNQDSRNEAPYQQQQQQQQQQHQPQQYPSTIMDSSQNREEASRKSSSTHSEESGYIRRDSKSGGSNSWRDSRTDQESSSTSKAEKSSASMEEVLESLLAIPPSNSRSSSPTSPRRSRGHSLQHLHHQQYRGSKVHQEDTRLTEKEAEVIKLQPSSSRPTSVVINDIPQRIVSSVESSSEGQGEDQGKLFDASLNFPPFPSSTTSTNQQLFPLEEVNHGSFCRSSSTSPLEDDVHSPTSMEVLVPEGEEQDLSSIIEDDTKLAGEIKPSLNHHLYQPVQQASLHECHHHQRPPLRRQSTLPSCSSNDPLAQPQEEEFTNLFAGLQSGSYSRGRGPSTHEESGTTPRKKTTSATEGHLKCHRPRCNKSLPTEEARARFRTCPNCYTYYCSRQCRKLHLARHKDHCPQTRISNLCKQVLMKARDDPVSRRHLSLCARRGLLSRGRGAVKLLFLCPEDALDYLVHGWEAAKGQTLYVSRADLLPQEMGSDVFSQVRSFCDKYNPERKFILLAAITVTNDIAQALDREVVVRGAKMHLSASMPEDDVQTLILTISKTDPHTGDPIQSTKEDRSKGLSGVIEQLSSRGVDVEKLYPHTFRKITKFVEENEPFSPISIFPTDQRNGRVFMCIILPWADADIIVNISSKDGVGAGKSSKKKWML